MSYGILLTPEAEDQLRQGDAWWQANRPAAADLLIEEFERTVDLLREMAGLGSPFPRARILGIRRILLRRSGYWVYYLPDEAHSVVYILAVWSGHRGIDPSLAAPRS